MSIKEKWSAEIAEQVRNGASESDVLALLWSCLKEEIDDKTAPTNREKNALPIDVRIAFNEGVELYQTISNYELGILTDAEFIKKMREIKAKFAQPVLT